MSDHKKFPLPGPHTLTDAQLRPLLNYEMAELRVLLHMAEQSLAALIPVADEFSDWVGGCGCEGKKTLCPAHAATKKAREVQKRLLGWLSAISKDEEAKR